MNIEDFRAGRWQQRYQYKSFEPEPVNHEWTWHAPAINALLEQATIALGKLDAFSRIVPDVDLFIEICLKLTLSCSLVKLLVVSLTNMRP